MPAESGAPVSAVRTADDDGGQGQASSEAAGATSGWVCWARK